MVKSNAPFVRSPYNYDLAAASNESGLFCQDESLTQQNFKDDCDINSIVATFARSGELPAAPLPPRFGDFTGVSDFHSALNKVLSIQEAFMELKPDIRARFNNDPQGLLDFLSDPENRAEAEQLGLISPKDLSTGAQAAPQAKRSAPVGKSDLDGKTVVEPFEGSTGGE